MKLIDSLDKGEFLNYNHCQQLNSYLKIQNLMSVIHKMFFQQLISYKRWQKALLELNSPTYCHLLENKVEALKHFPII